MSVQEAIDNMTVRLAILGVHEAEGSSPYVRRNAKLEGEAIGTVLAELERLQAEERVWQARLDLARYRRSIPCSGVREGTRQ